MSDTLMAGALLSLLGALFFSFNNLVTRRAVLRIKNTSPGVAMSVFVSLPVLFLALVVTGKIGDLFRFSWGAYLWLLGAGIIHYYAGRLLNVRAVQAVGANLAGILRRSSPLVAVFLGIVVLREAVTGRMLLAIAMVLAGVLLVGWTPWQPHGGKTSFARIGSKGILLGLGAGACYGISPLMIKMALNDFSSPLAAVFITFVGAAVVHAAVHVGQQRRTALLTMESTTMWLFNLSGVLVVFAQVARFFALSLAPISVVSPLFDINPMMVILLSYIFNRKLEVFSKSLIVSGVLVVAGSVLLIGG